MSETKGNCVFCRIAEGEEEARVVYRSDQVTAFHDIAPQAPTHIVLIPNRHIESLVATTDEDTELLGAMLNRARQIASDEGLDADGYRLVINTGADAGQSVPHLHLHILGGRRMKWPPG
ncbi:MAG: histidine triad nucleotide-binding protein [Anaerolineae bacterium]